MLNDLERERIAPILVFDLNGKTTVPLFRSMEVAKKFAKRNTPRKYTIGTLEAGAPEMKAIEGNGWETVIFDFPNKRDVRVEVIELGEVETRNSGRR
jgi:hypothetical protein